MRRKPGAILPLEESILTEAVHLVSAGDGTFHGFEIAKRISAGSGTKALTAHGTLYKALSRMEKAGLLKSSWEDPQLAADEGRPRRRLYRITGAGEVALSRLEAERRSYRQRSDPGLATS